MSENLGTNSEGSVFQVLEGVFYYVDPTTSSNTMNVFVGSKECECIPLLGKHCSLRAFVRHMVEHAGLMQGAEKRGLRFSIIIVLLRNRTRW